MDSAKTEKVGINPILKSIYKANPKEESINDKIKYQYLTLINNNIK